MLRSIGGFLAFAGTAGARPAEKRQHQQVLSGADAASRVTAPVCAIVAAVDAVFCPSYRCVGSALYDADRALFSARRRATAPARADLRPRLGGANSRG